MLSNWRAGTASPYPGVAVASPCHFILRGRAAVSSPRHDDPIQVQGGRDTVDGALGQRRPTLGWQSPHRATLSSEVGQRCPHRATVTQSRSKVEEIRWDGALGQRRPTLGWQSPHRATLSSEVGQRCPHRATVTQSRSKVEEIGGMARWDSAALVRLRRQPDRAVQVRSCAVKNRAVSNRNCVAARRGGEQRNENDQSVTQEAPCGQPP